MACRVFQGLAVMGIVLAILGLFDRSTGTAAGQGIFQTGLVLLAIDQWRRGPLTWRPWSILVTSLGLFVALGSALLAVATLNPFLMVLVGVAGYAVIVGPSAWVVVVLMSSWQRRVAHLVALLIVCAFCWLFRPFAIPDHEAFQPLYWRSASSGQREPMARDFLATRDVTEMTAEEVEALLGPPLKGFQARWFSPGKIVYRVGSGIPDAMVFLQFDVEDGQIRSGRVWSTS